MPIPCVCPTGVTDREARVGAVTVSDVDCEIPARLAEMLVEPAAIALTSPLAFTVAILVCEELQVASAVISALLPSL
jgi:hypothetical protein